MAHAASLPVVSLSLAFSAPLSWGAVEPTVAPAATGPSVAVAAAQNYLVFEGATGDLQKRLDT